jgi:predicted Zn-dependent peptidase
MAYMTDNYRASRMVLSVSGNIDEAAVLAEAGGQFGGVAENSDLYQEKAVFGGGEQRIERGTEQVHFVMGFEGVLIHDDACHSHGVLAQVPGGGMASRLFMEIREKRGLVYSIYASPNAFCDGGSMSIYAGTGCDEIAELVPVLCDELNKVRGTVTADEVERAKRQLKAGLAGSQESPTQWAERSANQIFDYGRVIPVAETMAKIDAVTADSVMAVAERIFRSRPAVAAVGRLDKLEAYDTLAARLAA